MSDRTGTRHEIGELADLLLPHLDSAYNLARWLMRNVEDAEDVVQEAYLRAFQYAGFRGGNARAWLLTIVRNTSYRWLRKRRTHEPVAEFDEGIHTRGSTETPNPEQLLLQNADRQLIEQVLSGLPVRFREILVLRELEGLSYKEIATVMGVPIGTVMSMLSRARDRFRHDARPFVKTDRSPQGDGPARNACQCAGAIEPVLT